MLFNRREQSSLLERFRVWLWPRRSWHRSAQYVIWRLRRLRSTPHAIALGCAFGIFMSFTPFLGFHMLVAGTLSWFSRASILAAALGTFVGNPLTFPFMWVGAYELGTRVMGEVSRGEVAKVYAGLLRGSGEQVWAVMMPMAVGGTVLGLVAATLSYFPIRKLVEVYQRRRRLHRITTRREALAARRKAKATGQRANVAPDIEFVRNG